MLSVRLNDNSEFMFCEDIELLFAAQNILQDERFHNLCTQLYGLEVIASLKREHRFLYEVFKSLGSRYSYGIMEHLLSYGCDSFTLAGFRDYLINMDPAVFIGRFFELDEDKLEAVKGAVTSDQALEALYSQFTDVFDSYLGFQSFFRQAERCIKEFFALAEKLRTESFASAVHAARSDVMQELDRVKAGLSETPPLAYSEQLMGKTFFNRGPYAVYVFSPSLLIPHRAVRFSDRDQLLFYSIRPEQADDQKMLKQLKVIADRTRFQIISLLSGKAPLRGIDVAEALSLAPSTVSHHMEQLVKAGLLNEEQVKNSKYYTVNKNNVAELMKRLTEAFGR